jgi:endonuclease YncB( thermonuclease family)
MFPFKKIDPEEKTDVVSQDVDVNVEKIKLSDCIIYMPPIKKARVVKVYDGDTITIGTYLYGSHDLQNSSNYPASKTTSKSIPKPYKFSLRLYGVDTPELRTSNEIEKQAGYLVKKKLEEYILHKTVEVELMDKYDKYGRLLGFIYLFPDISDHWDHRGKREKSVNQWLIDNKYAYPYDGTTKSVVDWSYLLGDGK